jgi:hypothetical protein
MRESAFIAFIRYREDTAWADDSFSMAFFCQSLHFQNREDSTPGECGSGENNQQTNILMYAADHVIRNTLHMAIPSLLNAQTI